MNKIDQAFAQTRNGLLNIYFTAGYPGFEDTKRVAKALQNAGVDMIEIGIPYSDPIADGAVIQESSAVAINNGMTINVLFEQLADIHDEVTIPIILMGYFNPILQYGIERFCEKCKSVGVSGTIIPDLPMNEYTRNYKSIFESSDLYNIFLITPQTPEDRIRIIDNNSKGFIYMVSSAGTTGARQSVSSDQLDYFQRTKSLNLKNKTLIGFGISNKQTFQHASGFADGAIIGSAFIKELKIDSSDAAIHSFVNSIKN